MDRVILLFAGVFAGISLASIFFLIIVFISLREVIQEQNGYIQPIKPKKKRRKLPKGWRIL